MYDTVSWYPVLGDYVTVAKSETPTYQRASTFINAELGEKLDKIADKDVLLHSYEYEDRGENSPAGFRYLVTMDVSTVDDPENVLKFHAWSKSLGDRLERIPEDTTWPLVANFTKVKTRAGFMVWTII